MSLSAYYLRSFSSDAELELCSHHSLDTVVHILDEIFLATAETTLVRDVEDAIAGIGVLTVLTTYLNVELVSDALEARPVLHKGGETDVDGGAHSGT